MKTIRIFLVVAVIPLLASLCLAVEAAPRPPLPESVGPYLQNPAPDAVTVCFATAGSGGEVSVFHGARDSDTELAAVGAEIPGTPWKVWKARIEGLKPGAAHSYRVVWKDGGQIRVESPLATFKTPDPAAGKVRMIVVNDIHNRHGTLEALMRQVKSEDYEFSVLLGDCWTDPSPKKGAERVVRTLAACIHLLDAASKPMFLVRGNHETRGAFSGRMAMFFDIPGLDSAKKKDEQQWWFSFRDGPVFFIAADTGEDDGFATPEDSYKRPKFWQAYRKRQTPWLEDLIARNAAGDASWKVFLPRAQAEGRQEKEGNRDVSVAHPDRWRPGGEAGHRDARRGRPRKTLGAHDRRQGECADGILEGQDRKEKIAGHRPVGPRNFRI